MTRLFIAVWPSQEVVSELWGLPRKDRPGIRWVRPENWHVTLHFLGDADEDDVAERLAGFPFDAVDLRYGPGIDVLFDRVVALPVHGLASLAEAVGKVTRDLGSEPARKRWTGHMTLARLRAGARIPNVVGAGFSATQRVEEIALVASRLRPGGAEYETIATFRSDDTARSPHG